VKKVSLRKIAQVAGVSHAAAGFALQNQPGVSAATRERILKVARELGYSPDARLGQWMTGVRKATSKDLLPIAWLNTSDDEDSWHHHRFHTPYLEGARARALELGYKLDEIWCRQPKMTMRRLAEILYQRGIEGVIVTHPARHFRLNWDHLASVSLGATLMAPRLHRITTDLNFNLQLALKSLRRLGYQRIGICLQREVDTASHSGLRAMARDLYFNASRRRRIPPLFHPPAWKKGYDQKAHLAAWLRRYKPDAIVGYDNHLVLWTEEAGFRVPEDIGVAHLAVDDDVLDWGGIHSRRSEIGATAVDWLVSLMRNHQFGVPKTPLTITVRGSWQMGRTLRRPGKTEEAAPEKTGQALITPR
jgi:LacI family transcriptional regulator